MIDLLLTIKDFLVGTISIWGKIVGALLLLGIIPVWISNSKNKDILLSDITDDNYENANIFQRMFSSTLMGDSMNKARYSDAFSNGARLLTIKAVFTTIIFSLLGILLLLFSFNIGLPSVSDKELTLVNNDVLLEKLDTAPVSIPNNEELDDIEAVTIFNIELSSISLDETIIKDSLPVNDKSFYLSDFFLKHKLKFMIIFISIFLVFLWICNALREDDYLFYFVLIILTIQIILSIIFKEIVFSENMLDNWMGTVNTYLIWITLLLLFISILGSYVFDILKIFIPTNILIIVIYIVLIQTYPNIIISFKTNTLLYYSNTIILSLICLKQIIFNRS